ncbi:MAG: hypothetical protein ACLPX9_08025 [Rhodomicrobium sp.]
MRRALVIFAFCVAVPCHASAACPDRGETINAWGREFTRGGLLGALRDGDGDCDRKQPEWLATINAAPAKNGSPPGLVYCRQIVSSKDPQQEAQRRDCIFWYGHSIEVP